MKKKKRNYTCGRNYSFESYSSSSMKLVSIKKNIVYLSTSQALKYKKHT